MNANIGMVGNDGFCVLVVSLFFKQHISQIDYLRNDVMKRQDSKLLLIVKFSKLIFNRICHEYK